MPQVEAVHVQAVLPPVEVAHGGEPPGRIPRESTGGDDERTVGWRRDQDPERGWHARSVRAAHSVHKRRMRRGADREVRLFLIHSIRNIDLEPLASASTIL